MTKDHRRLAEELAQGILLDAPGFFKKSGNVINLPLLHPAVLSRAAGEPGPSEPSVATRTLATNIPTL
ncbi:MAG: hypothetical protein IRY88_12840 [Rubrobacteraceae bacterium]|nr:hypothetical protein [Rubrobacteraceae bacterium]